MDILHGLREFLVQLNNVRSASLERGLDFFVKPGIYMDLAELELFHYILERGHARRDVLRLVGEGFKEAGCIFFTIQPDDERFEGEGCYSVLRRWLS
jgi:hypothetical protein